MYVPGAAVLGTLNTPVSGSKVEPVVGATVCVRVTFVVVAAVVPLVWSLLKTFRLVAVANGVVVLSLTASIRFTVALVVLLVATLSLVALVAPLTPTLVGVVSVPPAVPGMVTVNGQVSVAPIGKEAAVPLLATQAPTTTVAPAGVPAVAVQVALVAAVVVETLVQTKLTPGPDRTAPGAAVAGKPLIATLMSAAAPTVMVAVAVSHAAGVTAGLVQIW